MPTPLAGFPFYALSFDRDANPTDPHEAKALRQRLTGDDPPAHLVVISHGWKNDTAQATDLYRSLLQSVHNQAPRLDAVVAGVFWPSKKFADKALIPGGAASAGGDELLASLDALDDGSLTPEETEALAMARALVPNLDVAAAQEAFVERLRMFLPDEDDTEETPPQEVYHSEGSNLLEALASDTAESDNDASGGGAAGGGAASRSLDEAPQGGAAGVGSILKKIRNGALNLANLATYYGMKHRAGTVGDALADVLDDLARAAPGVHIHLIGHSFGARLVTAASAATDVARPASLSLLQAAFSHNGFAKGFDGTRDGGYRTVVTGNRIQGPIVITHTHNDTAVGLAYAAASRVGRQNANAVLGVGGAKDIYGGLGANGAQHTPETDQGSLLAARSSYAFKKGTLHNLLADAFISDHNAITGPEVATAVLAAIHTGTEP